MPGVFVGPHLHVELKLLADFVRRRVAPEERALQDQVQLAARAAQAGGGRVVVGGAGMARILLPEDVHLLRSMRELTQQIETVGRQRVVPRV